MHLILWGLIGCSMVAWAWASLRGGKLDDRQYLLFSAGLMVGQLSGAAEALLSGAYGTAVSQLHFFAFTLIGVGQRLADRNSADDNAAQMPARLAASTVA